jgi:hypothetical protein
MPDSRFALTLETSGHSEPAKESLEDEGAARLAATGL